MNIVCLCMSTPASPSPFLYVTIKLFYTGEATLTSRCQEGMVIEMTCTVRDVPSLRWIFNNDDTASFLHAFSHSDEYPLPLTPNNPTFTDIQVVIQSATASGDRFSANSILTASLQTLLTLGVHSVKCGSAEGQSESIIITSAIRCEYNFVYCSALLIVFEIGNASLDLMSSPTSTTGIFCPGPVNFTCIGTEIMSSFSWLINSSTSATYFYQDADTFPRTLTINSLLDGVTVEVTNATINPSITSTFDMTSVLSANDVSVFNDTSLQCVNTVTGATRLNNKISIQVYNSRLGM